MNKEILDKIDEIINLIEESSEYQKYQTLQKEIQKNDKLVKLINKVKVLQKDVVHHLVSNDELARTMDELNEHPLYREYNNTLSELNNTYAIIENSINHYFQEKLN